jgi:hypothetical protein
LNDLFRKRKVDDQSGEHGYDHGGHHSGIIGLVYSLEQGQPMSAAASSSRGTVAI